MNREYELLALLKEPVRFTPKRWALSVDFKHRFIFKSYGGRGKGRWLLFADRELAPYKPFSDSLLATLCAKGLLTKFCRENDRAFFLKEQVDNTPYDKYSTIEVYKRAK